MRRHCASDSALLFGRFSRSEHARALAGGPQLRAWDMGIMRNVGRSGPWPGSQSDGRKGGCWAFSGSTAMGWTEIPGRGFKRQRPVTIVGQCKRD